MTKAIYVIIMILLFTGSIFAQSVGINENGSSPNSKAMLDVSSTTKGLLPPRMTYAQKILIASPPAGLMIWCSDCGTSGEMQVNNGTIWTNLTGGPASGLPGAPTIGTATAGIWQALVPFTAPVSDGGSAITSYTATSNPDGKTGTLTQAGSGTITVTGLTGGTPYTFTVTATNVRGTGAASAASNSVTPVAGAIGDSYGGGIIAYILQSGDPGYSSSQAHGLIAATADQSAGIVWCTAPYYDAFVTGGTGTAIGTGLSNTNKIIAQNGAGTSYASGLARSYAGGGYSDWFLPSQDEVYKLYLNRVAIGGFGTYRYWSSSEQSISFAWAQKFDTGLPDFFSKFNTFLVRAVRAF